MSGQTADQHQQPNPKQVIDSLLLQYKLSLQAGNRSPKTTSWYFDILAQFFSFLEINNLLKPIEELGKEELKAYIRYLQKKTKWDGHKRKNPIEGGLSPFSIQGHVRAIKAFFGWLYRDEYLDQNKLGNFPLPKVPNLHMPTLTAEQIMKLLSAIDRSTPTGLRNHLMLSILHDTGVRISELLNLRVADIDLLNHVMTVIGKGQKQRYVPFSGDTRKKLKKYMCSVRPQICTSASPYLFVTKDGTTIRINCVEQMLKRLAKKAGMQGIKVSPHVFRHSHATQSIANGANPFALKETMGHASIATTMKYTHLQPKELVKMHDKYSPMHNLHNTMNK
jgi:integrase/recombinase XerD